MKKTLLALIACVSAAAALTALTPEETLDRRGIGDLDFAPDGSRLTYTVTEPVKATTRARSIWLFDLAAGQSRQLTFSGKSDSGARWAPDGQSIAFVSDREGQPHLYLLSMRGGDAEKIVDAALQPATAPAFRWSPSGTRIAFLMNEPKSDERQKREQEKDDSRVVDRDDRHAR